MRLEIRMPRVSEYSDEGRIAKWRVSVGDVVQKGEVVADAEVDMGTREILAEADGKIVEIWVHAGQSVPIETVIAMQSVADDAVIGDPPEDKSVEETTDEETVQETDGEAEEQFPELGEEISSREDQSADETADQKDEAVVQYGHILASSAAIQLAQQHNVKLDTLTGTGQCGRIEREDVEAAMQTRSQFITPEDVDDLMNFDGDFSSKMPSDDPGMHTEPAEMETDAVEPRDDSPREEPTDETPEPDTAEEKIPDDESASEDMAPEEEAAVEQEDEASDEIAEETDMPDEEPVDEIEDETEAESADEEEQSVVDEQDFVADESVADEGETEADESAPDDSDAPGVIYMGEAPAEEATETVAQDDQPTEDPAPGFGQSQDISEAPEALEEPFVAGEETEMEVEVEDPFGEGIDSLAVDEPEQEEETNQEEDFTPEEEPEVEEEAAPEEETEAEEEPASEAVSAYTPTAEELQSVTGFSALANDDSEPEALAIDESDTIDTEEADDSEPVFEETFDEDQVAEEEPEPVRLAESTVDDVIEQTTVDEPEKSVKVRRLVARKMEQSWQNAPHFFVTVAVDMTDVIRFRSDLGVTINDFILAATTRALQEHPWVNSHFINDEAVEQSEINIGIAVETEKGLYYPVVKGCGGKSVKELGVAAAEMVVKAHSGKLAEDEMEGGSFTISNMGMLGVESFSAIITPPQVAVLAVGTVRGEVIIDEHEEMTMAPMVRLTLSADHRALDGADAADFLGTMKSYLEAPITLVASQEER